jgi:hypothetical protein
MLYPLGQSTLAHSAGKAGLPVLRCQLMPGGGSSMLTVVCPAFCMAGVVWRVVEFPAL